MAHIPGEIVESGGRKYLKLADDNPMVVAARILSDWAMADVLPMSDCDMDNVQAVARWLTKGER